MILEFRGTARENLATLMRRIGYAPHFDKFKKEMTYAKKIQGTMFPRFHINIWKESIGYLKFNLHLDAKRESYSGVSMHSGEYDTDVVLREGSRVKTLLDQAFSGTDDNDNQQSNTLAPNSTDDTGVGRKFMNWLHGA